MPTYVYKDLVTGETFEIFQKMKDEHLVVSPTTGNPVQREFTTFAIKCGTVYLGDVAEKNTEKLIKEGKIKKKKKPKNPWWRDKKKPLNVKGWSKKQTEKYIMEGKKP